MLKTLNKIFQIFIDLLVFIITILILFSLYKLITINVFHKPYANILGYSAFEIATGSMEPTLNVKDLIIVKITKDVSQNDIITYKEENALITHRVIKKEENTLITKGDANNSIDVKIKSDDVVGKVVYVIKNGGLIREIFLTPKITISVIITLILISICLSTSQKKETKKTNTKPDKVKPNKVKSKEKIKKEENIIIEAEDELKNTKSFQNLKEEVFKALESEKKKSR